MIMSLRTSPGTTVDLDSHASGARMVTVRQESDLIDNDGMIQLLGNGQPRIRIARKDLKDNNKKSFRKN